MKIKNAIRTAALALLALVALSNSTWAAPNFVDNNTNLPANKTDKTPVTDATRQWAAADANAVFSALTDIRTVLQRNNDVIYNVKAYGAFGDNSHDDSTAIQNAANAAALTVNGAFGATVYFPRGTYRIGSQIVIPGGVELRGVNPASTILKATATFNAASMIRNQNQDGSQEYAFISNMLIDGNQGSGAIESTAVVDFGGLFINSWIRDVIIVNGSNVGLHIFAPTAGTGGSGPVLLENVWQTNCLGHGILIEEQSGSSNAFQSIVGINVTSEHVGGSGKSAIYLKGVANAAAFNFYNTHIELANVGTSITGITLDGVADVVFNGVVFDGDPVQDTGIVVTTAVPNVRYAFYAVHNHNGIPVLVDNKAGVSLGAVHLPEYKSSDWVIRGAPRFVPVSGSTGKSLVAQDSSGTDRAWFNASGQLSGSSTTGGGIDLKGDETNNRAAILVPNTASGYTSAFGWFFPAASGGVLRERSFASGVDVRQIGTDGSEFHYQTQTFQSNTTFQSKVLTTGTAPTLSSCGTSPSVDINSTNTNGEFTTGSAATTCTVTFSSAFANKPHCVVSGSGVIGPTYTTSTTAITITVDVASTTYRYFCGGH